MKAKIIIERHEDGYVAYPIGLKGIIVGQGDAYETVLANVLSAVRFHLETFGLDSLDSDDHVLEAFVANPGGMISMDISFDEILDVVRKPADPSAAFAALRNIGKSRMPSEIWDEIGTPDAESDVWSAGAWLKESMAPFEPSGVYLGLDTLNENRGDGKNIEIGMTCEVGPRTLSMDWIYALEIHGNDHLIDGIHKAHRVYERRFGSAANLLADYLSFSDMAALFWLRHWKQSRSTGIASWFGVFTTAIWRILRDHPPTA